MWPFDDDDDDPDGVRASIYGQPTGISAAPSAEAALEARRVQFERDQAIKAQRARDWMSSNLPRVQSGLDTYEQTRAGVMGMPFGIRSRLKGMSEGLRNRGYNLLSGAAGWLGENTPDTLEEAIGNPLVNLAAIWHIPKPAGGPGRVLKRGGSLTTTLPEETQTKVDRLLAGDTSVLIENPESPHRRDRIPGVTTHVLGTGEGPAVYRSRAGARSSESAPPEPGPQGFETFRHQVADWLEHPDQGTRNVAFNRPTYYFDRIETIPEVMKWLKDVGVNVEGVQDKKGNVHGVRVLPDPDPLLREWILADPENPGRFGIPDFGKGTTAQGGHFRNLQKQRLGGTIRRETLGGSPLETGDITLPKVRKTQEKPPRTTAPKATPPVRPEASFVMTNRAGQDLYVVKGGDFDGKTMSKAELDAAGIPIRKLGGFGR